MVETLNPCFVIAGKSFSKRVVLPFPLLPTIPNIFIFIQPSLIDHMTTGETAGPMAYVPVDMVAWDKEKKF